MAGSRTRRVQTDKDRNLPEKILIDADTHIPQAHALAELFFNNYLGKIESA